jgi:hypothetical protein
MLTEMASASKWWQRPFLKASTAHPIHTPKVVEAAQPNAFFVIESRHRKGRMSLAKVAVFRGYPGSS